MPRLYNYIPLGTLSVKLYTSELTSIPIFVVALNFFKFTTPNFYFKSAIRRIAQDE